MAEFSLKFLPNDLNAAIGLAQLAKLDVHQAYRQEIWQLFQKEFADLDWLITPTDPADDERHSYFTYLVRLSGGQRDQLAHYLFERDIYTTVRFHPLHLNPIYGSSDQLPVCEQLNEEALNLPLHPNLSSDDLDQIISTVRDFGSTL